MKNETDFQQWVQDKLSAVGHVHDHRMSHLPHVPDLSAGVHGDDFWLELKYDVFNLGHDRYDDFKYSKESAGQVEWLKNRQANGSAICGLLGFLNTGPHVQYLCFMPPHYYRLWRGTNVGAVLLTPFCAAFDREMTGRDLVRWLRVANRCTSRPGT